MPMTSQVSGTKERETIRRPRVPRAEPARQYAESTSGLDIALSDSASQFEDGDDASEADFTWEYHEPWSWTSICSDTGSKWLWTVTGNRGFAASAKRFAKDLVRRSSYDRYLSTSAASPEPDEATAWRYVTAFYQNCWEADIGIIDRTDLEPLLQAHFRSPPPKSDPALFALRNVVYAGGYRSLLARDPNITFATAQAKAKRYFRNALSVFTNLLLPPSTLTAVRAMTLMACYVEGLGNPPFQAFLCSNAVHLAQSKGLHRQPDKSWGTSENETLKRNWLWWAIYSLEKHLALSGGRPSAIDDDNVSAQIPVAVPNGSNIHAQLFSTGIRHAKIQSQISRQLLSLKALSLPTGELVNTITHFHNQLKQLLDDMPADFKIGTLGRPTHSTSRLILILFLHVSIYGSMMAAHAHFFYPWMISRFTSEGYNADLETYIASSSATVAEGARKIILALRLVNTNVATPSWLAFYYPIYAVINLFIYILKYPGLSTTAADLGLLDVCAGHFGYIEFLTSSKVSVSLPREAANVASRVVKRAKMKASGPTSVASTISPDFQSNGSQPHAVGMDGLDFARPENEAAEFGDFGNLTNLDLAAWNLLSSFDMICPNTLNRDTFT